MRNRAFGPYGWIFWMLIAAELRHPPIALVAQSAHDPMTALSSSRSPPTWACGWSDSSLSSRACTTTSFPRVGRCIYPTIWDWATLFGSIGLFLTLLFLFIRYMPMISMSETRELIAQRKEGRL